MKKLDKGDIKFTADLEDLLISHFGGVVIGPAQYRDNVHIFRAVDRVGHRIYEIHIKRVK